jgi:hypothetical protein
MALLRIVTGRRPMRRLTAIKSGVLLTLLPLLPASNGWRDDRVPVTEVESGSVVTVGVGLPGEPFGSRVDYRIRPLPSVRIIGSLAGSIEAIEGTIPMLPVTFSVSRDERAGRHVAATVDIERDDGSVEAVEIWIDVKRRYRLALQGELVTGVVAPNGSTSLRYRIANQGNAPDTVDLRVTSEVTWTVAGEASALVIPAGDEVHGTLRLTAADNARAGETYTLRLTADGRGSEEVLDLDVLVGREPELVPGLLHLPATVYLGVSDLGGGDVGASQLGLGIRAAGQIGRETSLYLDYGRAPRSLGAIGVGNDLAFERLRVSLASRSWSASAGDVYAAPSRLLDAHLAGRGAAFRVANERNSSELFLARPIGPASENPGHLAHLSAQRRIRLGTVGATLSDFVIPPAAFGSGAGGVQSMGVEYHTPESSMHAVAVEAAMMKVTDTDGQQTSGPAGFAQYTLRGAPGSLSARGRWAPAAVPGSGSPSREVSLGGTAFLVGGLSLDGLAFSHHYLTARGAEQMEADGVTVGARLFARGTALSVRGNHLETRNEEGWSAWSGETTRRTVTSAVFIPVGPLALNGSTELGEVRHRDGSGPLQSHRANVSWTGTSSRGWIGASHGRLSPGGITQHLEAGASYLSRRAELELGGRLPIGGETAGGEMNLWSSALINVSNRVAVFLGAEHQPWLGASPWRFTVGLRQRLSLPLPVRHLSETQGVVFEDLNGNRRLDPGEPGISGVSLVLGTLRVTTDARGRFSFATVAGNGRVLNVDAATLPMGMIVPPDARLEAVGRVEVPVVRTASMRMYLTEQRNASGPLALAAGPEGSSRARVTLIAPDGRRREVIAEEDGSAMLDALLPGNYVALVAQESDAASGPYRMELAVSAGEDRIMHVALPSASREIRFNSGNVAEADLLLVTAPRWEPASSAREPEASTAESLPERLEPPAAALIPASGTDAGTRRLSPPALENRSGVADRPIFSAGEAEPTSVAAPEGVSCGGSTPLWYRIRCYLHRIWNFARTELGFGTPIGTRDVGVNLAPR